jgi:hypothetical protein
MVYLNFVFTSLLAIGLAFIINQNRVFELTVVAMLGLIYYTLLKMENKQ